MADVNGYATYLLAGNGHASVSPNNAYNARNAPGITYEYQMECTDATLTTKTTWLVQGAPDFNATTTAALTAISNAGLNTPVRLIRVISQWPVS
jgi:hypothetical protein